MEHASLLTVQELNAIGHAAGREAIDRAFAAGVSVVGLDGALLVEYFPDGRRRVLEILESKENDSRTMPVFLNM